MDEQKIIQNFSTAHYKTLLCPHHHGSQQFCKYSPYGLCFRDPTNFIGVPQDLPHLPAKKCVFKHGDDLPECGLGLPPGWRESRCPATNKLRYQHFKTGRVQWERPGWESELKTFDPSFTRSSVSRASFPSQEGDLNQRGGPTGGRLKRLGPGGIQIPLVAEGQLLVSPQGVQVKRRTSAEYAFPWVPEATCLPRRRSHKK
ncbi:hypothetical protein B484DRAFT_450897 [Ochromonadaceae sp. CCMP2298]|nr:hypothetical protein B484DRAFT_450897 [Ochromonadaceae sp. CCMP2298]|mmetsp:Transcript_7628/g.16712  ORF Transcript_7628/g.16712 Transcript_7628/m.16712 type:complete len:201 (-) Transcript_7628:252-854(-)|eukprot:CAMPEP_0173255036 /NCGR_PEP_ID=MMETSP1142-20121109/22286_1 /TAXON_ID=483371 /ORGANISM="non described non described, Strain CCMP2298" /LENGTH=200 /DNA_ID=CAMNT_0014188599 /DNA_START=107 /DNA_END=709 /DNA_ORIENTATION=+